MTTPPLESSIYLDEHFGAFLLKLGLAALNAADSIVRNTLNLYSSSASPPDKT